MPATLLEAKREVVTRFNTSTHAYQLSTAPRQQNEYAAVGLTFDYRIQVAAFQSDGVTVDTSFTGAVTIAPSGGFTLGSKTSTPLTRNAVAGIADFSDVYPVTGTGVLTLTVSAGGLTSYVPRTITVVTPQWDMYQRSLGNWILIEKPRQTVNTAYPTVFSQEYTLNPSLAPSATNVQTYAAALAKFVGDNGGLGYTTHTRFKVSRQVYTETINLPPAPNTGFCVFEPVGGIDTPVNQRAAPADFITNPVVVQTTNILGTVQCNGAASRFIFGGHKFTKIYAGVSDVHSSIVNIHNNDLDDVVNTGNVYQQPSYIGFERCYLTGAANLTTLKGFIFNGRHLWENNCYTDEIHATHSQSQSGVIGAIDTGSGDEQSLCCVGAFGPICIDNSMHRTSGEGFLLGGGSPQFYDMRNRDVTITRSVFWSPLAWKGIYKNKNNVEFKSAERVWLNACIFDGAWSDGQEGAGMHVASGNQSGGTPNESYYNFEGTKDVLLTNLFFRTMTAFLNMTAAISSGSDPMRSVGGYNFVAVNIDDPATHYSAGSTGWLMLFGGGFSLQLRDSNLRHMTIIAHPSSTAAALLFNSTSTIANSVLRDSIFSAPVPGVYVSGGNLGRPGYVSVMIDDLTPKGNIFIGFNNSYPYNYALPTDLPNDGIAATLADVGFTDVSGISSYSTLAPETILAGLVLQDSSQFKGVASDGTDPGADIPAMLVALTGVWNGTPGVGPGGGGGITPSVSGFNQLRRRIRLV